MKYLSVVITLFILGITQNVQSYNIGLGRADITGPAADINFMGYVNPLQVGNGILLRQFSRAFIADDGNNRAVFISVDLGMTSYGVRREVIKKLQAKYGDIYNDNNIMISSTHTHMTPGGYMLNFLYDMGPFAGVVEQTFNAYIDGITRSVERAHANLVDGKILYRKVELQDANRSRRSEAYLQNPQAERDMYEYNHDKDLLQLEFIRSSDGKSLGIFNWFAAHPVSMNAFNTKISSDSIGYTSMVMEERKNPADLPGKGDYVASMAASNLGDVSGVGDGDDEAHVKSIALKISKGALDLLETPGIELTGDILTATNYIEFIKESVEYTWENGTTLTGKGCNPALGVGVLRGLDNNYQLVLDKIREVMGDFPAEVSIEDEICQYPKEVLLATGALKNPYDWLPLTLPTQIATIGPLVLAAVPAEFTTMSGRRLRRALNEIMLTKPGVNPSDINIVIAGLSNSYSSYVATPEEYPMQETEGGFTLYGPYTQPIYVKHFSKLLTDMISGNPITRGTAPPEYPPPRVSLVSDAPVDGPDVPGHCRLEPPTSVQAGKKVTVIFEAGHPRNDLRHEDTFLTVEQEQSNGSWKVIANDASFETKFVWRKELSTYAPGPSLATIDWTIPEDIAKGVYRIGHFGSYNSPLLEDEAFPYFGYCNSFNVI